jgi:hypothetical protein
MKKHIYFNDSVANLGIAGVFTGSTVDLASYSDPLKGFYYTKFSAFSFSAQVSGTNGFVIETSNDNITWRVAAQVTTTAATPAILEVPLTTRYFRVKYTNGGVAQASFMLNSALL